MHVPTAAFLIVGPTMFVVGMLLDKWLLGNNPISTDQWNKLKRKVIIWLAGGLTYKITTLHEEMEVVKLP